MTRYVTLPAVLVVFGIALLLLPALFPVQPVLYHETSPGTMANGSVLEEQGHTIVAYQDLSPRGQEHYLRALRNDGRSFVPQGEGASEFSYLTEGELGETDDYRERMALQTIVVERPPNTSLPPPDEPVEAAEHLLADERRAEEDRRDGEAGSGERSSGESTAENDSETEPTVEELRRQIGRYDQMTTRTDHPPLSTPSSLLRLLSVIGGAVAIGTGGYLRSKP